MGLHLGLSLLWLAASTLTARGGPIRGVNLGGWLLAEEWLVPSVYGQAGNSAVIDEWTFGQYVPNAADILTSHWESFITEQDFADMAAAGLNFVRIPIGYWAYDTSAGEPYVQANQTAYLSRAVGWAGAHGLEVMIDLHGLPGSQNGRSNSGKAGEVNWQNAQSNAQRAQKIIGTIASEYANDGTVTHIELANEPLLDRQSLNGVDPFTKGYYSATSPQAASAASPTLHDGFLSLSSWYDFNAGGTNFVLDTHIYMGMYPYNGAQGSNTESYNNITDSTLRQLCGLKSTLAASQSHHSTLVGEWSIAGPAPSQSRRDLAESNTRDHGPPGRRKPHSIDVEPRGEALSAYAKQLFDTQRAVYEQTTSGWVFFTWKTESSSSRWSYQAGLKNGWITSNLNTFSASAC